MAPAMGDDMTAEELAEFKRQGKLLEYREKVKTHDLNMEALAEASRAFNKALHNAAESGKAINSTIFVQADRHDNCPMVFTKEQRGLPHVE